LNGAFPFHFPLGASNIPGTEAKKYRNLALFLPASIQIRQEIDEILAKYK